MNRPGPLISIAVVNWNTRERLLKCLHALRAEAACLALEVIVVDNGSYDRSAQAVQEQFPEILLLANRENRGFAAGINQALQRAQAPFWVLLNPDTQIQPGALQILVQDLEAHPEAWVVGPKLLNTDNSLALSGRRFPTLTRTWLEGLLPRKARDSDWWKRTVFGRLDFDVPVEVDEVSGACFMARQEVFKKIGFLDERFFIYFEEVDWFMRLAAAGGKVRYQPRARVFHQGGAATGRMKNKGILFNYRSQFKFWRKYRGRRGEVLVRMITACHALARTMGSLIKALSLSKSRRNLLGQMELNLKVFLLALGLRAREK